MSETLNFLRLVGDYWGVLGVKTAVRVRDALDNAEKEAYSFEKFTLDVLGFYNDSIGIGINLIGAQGKPLPVPTLPIPVALGADKGSGKIALGLAAGTVLSGTPLLNPPNAKVPEANVALSLPGGGVLQVDLSGLSTITVKGFWEGLAFGNGIPIAKIQLQIT